MSSILTLPNVSTRLSDWAQEAPDRAAVCSFDGRTRSFGDLDERATLIATGLTSMGLEPGDRACLFVRPGPELIELTHGCFRSGVVPVLIDPGMGRQSLLACIQKIQPRALIGIPRVHVASLLFPASFRSIRFRITVGRRLGWGGLSYAQLLDWGRRRTAQVHEPAPSDEAAVLFTSGSTGPPKGVTYTHGMFSAQLDALQRLYGLEPGEVDVACFPLFALFDNALGMTSIFPDIDPSHPAHCDPAQVFATIEARGATFTFGSPAIWKRLLAWAEPRRKRFTTLRRVTIAGAPIAPHMIEGLRAMLPAGADVHTPYGATEALPVSNISGSEIVGDVRRRTENGEGTCIGRPVPGLEVRLIEIEDGALQSWSDVREVEPGEPGEICVRGPMVTHEYKFDAEATRLAKIQDGSTVWHRMGDVGYQDPDGLYWYQGRKSHRLETPDGLLMPVPLENVFNTCQGVERTAVVGVGPRGQERPHLIVEANPRQVRGELLARLEQLERQSGLAPVEHMHFHPGLPVDVRHNAKIHRLELKRWAEKVAR